MKVLDGFLFSKLANIGSRSEGPEYFLQEFDLKEIPIVKKAHLWEEDRVLQKHLATKVTIRGRLVDGHLHYEEIHALKLATVA